MMNEELLCSVIAQPILHSSFFIYNLSVGDVWVDLFFYSVHLFDILNLLQVIADCFYIFHIMYPQLDFSFEYPVVCFNGKFTDIYVKLSGDDLSHFVQKPILSIPLK